MSRPYRYLTLEPGRSRPRVSDELLGIALGALSGALVAALIVSALWWWLG